MTPVYARMSRKTYRERYSELQCGQPRDYDASVGVYFPEDMPAEELVPEVFPSVLLSLAIKAAGTQENAEDPKAERFRTAQEIRSRAAKRPELKGMTLHEIKKMMQKIAADIRAEKEFKNAENIDEVLKTYGFDEETED